MIGGDYGYCGRYLTRWSMRVAGAVRTCWSNCCCRCWCSCCLCKVSGRARWCAPGTRTRTDCGKKSKRSMRSTWSPRQTRTVGRAWLLQHYKYSSFVLSLTTPPTNQPLSLNTDHCHTQSTTLVRAACTLPQCGAQHDCGTGLAPGSRASGEHY